MHSFSRDKKELSVCVQRLEPVNFEAKCSTCEGLQKWSVNSVKEPFQFQQQSFALDVLASSPVLSFHGFSLQLNSGSELHTHVVLWTGH